MKKFPLLFVVLIILFTSCEENTGRNLPPSDVANSYPQNVNPDSISFDFTGVFGNELSEPMGTVTRSKK